jgi:hypothetical protein
MNLTEIKSRIEKYKKIKAEIPLLEATLEELESTQRLTMFGQWAYARQNKHSAGAQAALDQISEVVGNIHAPDALKSELSAIYQPLKNAFDDLKAAKTQANELKQSITGPGDTIISQLRDKLANIQDRLTQKIINTLIPFTSPKKANELAKQTDSVIALEYMSTTIGVLDLGVSPETILSRITGLIGDIEKYEELAK